MSDLLDQAAAWWRDNVEGPLFGHRWVTLKSGAVVKLDQDGRIVHGGPKEWAGVHVRDVPTLAKQLRELQGVDCDKLGACDGPPCQSTFRTKDAGVLALLEANPHLRQFLEDEGGRDSAAYRAWMRGKRRGPKPELGAGDGRFDTLNERWDLKGPRRISSWLEAVYVTVPPSRRWVDLEERIGVLEEATGLDLRLPESAERRQLARASAEECHRRIDEQIGDLLAKARGERLTETEQEGVPF